jgi:hypothetical protein
MARPNIIAFYKYAVEMSTFDRMGLFGNPDLQLWVLFAIDGITVELFLQKSYRIRPDRLLACFRFSPV